MPNSIQTIIFNNLRSSQSPISIGYSVINQLPVINPQVSEHEEYEQKFQSFIKELEKMREFDFYFTDFNQIPAQVVHIKVPLISSYYIEEGIIHITYNQESVRLLDGYWRQV